MSWCPKVVFVLLLSKAYRDLPAWIKMWASPQPHRNTNRLWPLTTWSNIMWRLHINKHFEIAPVASTAIRGGPPQQSFAVTQRQHNWKTGMPELRKRKGQSGSEGVTFGWDGGVGKQLIWCRSWAAAIWLLRGLYALWLSGHVCSKVQQDLKRSSDVTAFSLSSVALWRRADQGLETLISLGRDSYTHTWTHSTKSAGSKPFVTGSWSTDLSRCCRTIRGSQSATVCFPVT